MFYRYFFLMALIFISGCATSPQYDVDTVARISGEKHKLGTPIMAAKCDYIAAQTGELEGIMRSGLCVSFNSAFVFRSIDVNDPAIGNSIVFYYTIIKGAGVSSPNIIGLRQLVLVTKTSSNAFLFRNKGGLGTDDNLTYKFFNIFTSRNIMEITEPKFLKIENSTNTIYLYTPSRKKK